MRGPKLAVHGFVLAGGKSSRMGVDKATLPFCGRPLVEIAVEKLRVFCAEVSIVGNREDLSGFAPVVAEARVDCGPAAGIEAGLQAAELEWALFVPVDVPLVPVELLRAWAMAVLARGCGASYLVVKGERQPAFCMARRSSLGVVSEALEQGERRLAQILESVDGLWVCDAAEVASASEDSRIWFSNVNTPEDLVEAEGTAEHLETGNRKSNYRDPSLRSG